MGGHLFCNSNKYMYCSTAVPHTTITASSQSTLNPHSTYVYSVTEQHLRRTYSCCRSIIPAARHILITTIPTPPGRDPQCSCRRRSRLEEAGSERHRRVNGGHLVVLVGECSRQTQRRRRAERATSSQPIQVSSFSHHDV